MSWSPQQTDALDRVADWMRAGTSQVFHLFGYAGTGKTTLAKHIREMQSGTVLFGAYTGKAAYVLRSKGCHGADTIHRLIYQSREKSQSYLLDLMNQLEELTKELRELGMEDVDILEHVKVRELKKNIREAEIDADEPLFVLNRQSDVQYAELVIIDECSMVDDQMGQDLLSFRTPVLVLGDPAQLPPVKGEGYFTRNVNPDVMLTEIHRQARDNPIIHLATKVREGEHLKIGQYGDDCVVQANGKMSPDETLSYDQILVGTNRMKFACNHRIRTLKDINDPYPTPGERLICLKNDHDLGLLNGAMYSVDSIEGVMDEKVHMFVTPDDQPDLGSIEVIAHEHHFFAAKAEIPFFQRKQAKEFDYGYAITVHKSQGSQWNNVCLLDESGCFRKDRAKWLYTGITRAAEKLTVVKI